MDFKKYIAQNIILDGINEEEIYALVTVAANSSFGDFALPCFTLAVRLNEKPFTLAKQIAQRYPKDQIVCEVEDTKGYVNFKINREYWTKVTLTKILTEGDEYGSSKIGEGKTICIDYSSINIAKPFHIGHLSTTVLGSCLYKIYKFLGYTVVGINYLGDYGTQFGKLVYAFEKWGDPALIATGGLRTINDLYVKFHKQAKLDASLEEKAREYSKKIEEGDSRCVSIYETLKAITLKEVTAIYKNLNVEFDDWLGESHFITKVPDVVKELDSMHLLTENDGAKIVDLAEHNMPPALILRSDGASLYLTRDIAAAEYRKEKYNFDKSLYVVAYQQNLHFKQLFKVLELMDKNWVGDMQHIAYGMVSIEGMSMSTRNGVVIYLEDVITQCICKAESIIQAKNPDLPDLAEVARKIGLGAVIFSVVNMNRIKDVVFSYDKILNFEGETACYVQYTCARANSILEKGNITLQEKNSIIYLLKRLESDDISNTEFDLIKKLSEFPSILQMTLEKHEPCFVTRYAITVAQLFNKFYMESPILNANSYTTYRLALTQATLTTLTNALMLLGIEVPKKM